MRLGLVAALVGAALLVLCGRAAAAPADLDRAFGGGDGIVEVPAPPAALPPEVGARMAIGPHDEIFVLYTGYRSCDPPFACSLELTVARFSAEGQLDPAFDVGAAPQLVVRQGPQSYDFDLAVGPDGKPVVVAFDGGEENFEAGEERLVVARLGLDGRLDPGFGVGGKAPYVSGHPIQNGRDLPVVAVQPDGGVLVAVEGDHTDTGSNLRLARYLPDGQFDPGFGTAGEAQVPLSTQGKPAGILLGASGSIIVPGPLCCRAGGPLIGEGLNVARLGPTGQPDPGWAGDGSLFLTTPGAQSGVEGATAAPDGGLFLSFEEETPAVSRPGNLVKLAASGAFDPGFGNGGRVKVFYRVGTVDPTDFAVDGAGRLIGVGRDSGIAVFRLRPDGSADRTFNGGQRLDLPFGGPTSSGRPYQVAVQSSGRIVAFGDSQGGAGFHYGLVGLRGGDDHSRCLGKRATIVGTGKKDELIGTPRRDVIAALGGPDEVRGLSGSDTICGGKGRDKLFGGAGKDQVQADPAHRRHKVR